MGNKFGSRASHFFAGMIAPLPPKQQSVAFDAMHERTQRIVNAQMGSESLMNAVVAAGGTARPYCCCFRNKVLATFTTFKDAAAYAGDSSMHVSILRSGTQE